MNGGIRDFCLPPSGIIWRRSRFERTALVYCWRSVCWLGVTTWQWLRQDSSVLARTHAFLDRFHSMIFVNRKAAPSLFQWLGAMAALLFLASHSGGPRLAAQCGPNPIVCENAQTGAPASEWDVTGAGDATLQGFATDISANKGDTVRF